MRGPGSRRARADVAVAEAPAACALRGAPGQPRQGPRAGAQAEGDLGPLRVGAARGRRGCGASGISRWLRSLRKPPHSLRKLLDYDSEVFTALAADEAIPLPEAKLPIYLEHRRGSTFNRAWPKGQLPPKSLDKHT